jgi:FixJ family two-component response regulator
MRETSVIAVVDDDESIRMAVASLLRSVGFVVLPFASAEEFLCGKDLQPISCLILDVRMPGMDGLHLLRHLRANGWRAPTIVLSAHGHDSGREQALAGGAIAFLPKPFDAEVLLSAVKSGFDGAPPLTGAALLA